MTACGTRNFKGMEIEWDLESGAGNSESPPWEETTLTVTVDDLEEMETSFDTADYAALMSEYTPTFDEVGDMWLYRIVPGSGSKVELTDLVREEILETLH